MSEIAAYKDEMYKRGKAPMTKREVRILSAAFLAIAPADVVVDIGAGTGGFTMEAAHAASHGKVYAVEAKPEARQLIQENARNFGADNVTLVPGKAPEALVRITGPVDRIFVGGTGGKMAAIFDWCHGHLKKDGRLVANFVTLENAARAKSLLDQSFAAVELIQVGITRGENLAGMTMLKAQNPIFILTAEK